MSGDRSPEMETFVAEARSVPILTAFERCGYSLGSLRRGGGEYVGPCPACGGKDRFALNERKQVFNCRGANGGDAIALAEHLTGSDFISACELLTGQDRPGREALSPAERESSRREAEARLAEQRVQAETDAARREAEADQYREREWERCLSIWREGKPFLGSPASSYLAARGLGAVSPDPAYLRFHEFLSFWDEGADKRLTVLHRGPAMLALFVRPVNGRWQPIGIHETWIDLGAAPKFRPTIPDPQKSDGTTLPTKKMRGSKAGGLLPLIGRWSTATRMVAGEGIETTLGFAALEGAPAGTFYCAAGDLGNL